MGSALCIGESASHAAAFVNTRPGCIVHVEQNRTFYSEDSLLHLPRELVVFCILPLLSIKSLVRLESALNGESVSEDICLQLRRIYGSERSCTALGNLRKEAWLLSRQIYPANVKVFYGVNNKELCRKREVVQYARVVSLNYCWMLSAQAIATFLVGCTNVTSLDLAHCFVKAPALRAIAFNCPQLTGLSLWGAQKVSSTGIELVMQRCTRLVDLKLSCSSGLTYHSIVHIAADLSGRLHTLHLSGLSTVSNFTLSHLKCPVLTDLDVSHCHHALGAGCLLSLVECPSLRVLNATCSVLYGGAIYPSVILALARACPDIQALDLSGYAHLHPDAVIAIIQQFPQLRRLALDSCTAVDDAVLLQIAGHSDGTLRELSVKHCPGVTPAGVAAFQQRYQHDCCIDSGGYPMNGAGSVL